MNLRHLLEPEETIGNLWYRMVGDRWSVAHFPDAAVAFNEIAPRLRVVFRGLGGDLGAELKPAMSEVSQHWLSRRQRLGIRSEKIARARYDGRCLSLPDRLDLLPDRDLNEQLYLWLAAWTAAAAEQALDAPADPLARDLACIDHAARTTCVVLARFPGLAKHYERLRTAAVAVRPQPSMPTGEAAVESRLLEQLAAVLGAGPPPGAAAGLDGPAPVGYRTYLPIPLWGQIEAGGATPGDTSSDEEPHGGRPSVGDGRTRKARRRRSDSIDRKGGLFVHRFEKILTWTEFMNLHRDVEDDDEDSVRRAADDHDEIGVARRERRAATRLRIDLDLSPADAEAERLSGTHLYPE